MYVIYEICLSREYFNLVLFNIIVEHDYLLTTGSKKDKKNYIHSLRENRFFTSRELEQCSSSSTLLEEGFKAHSVDSNHQTA